MASRKLPRGPSTVIGFTYGTFDLLHDGHRHLLRQARSQCDQLIVAIDSDRFAAKIKGPGRPVENEAVRSQNLVATGLVSLVIAVNDGGQLSEALAYYQPDILFAGDDGYARMPTRGPPPDVVLVPLLPGHSTTDAIRARLQ